MNIKRIRLDAEERIEAILLELADQGLPVFRMEVNSGRMVTIIFDKDGEAFDE